MVSSRRSIKSIKSYTPPPNDPAALSHGPMGSFEAQRYETCEGNKKFKNSRGFAQL